MTVLDALRKLPDRDLVAELDQRERTTGAAILAHLVVVAERSIHLDHGYGSVVEYVTDRLGTSRDVAYPAGRQATIRDASVPGNPVGSKRAAAIKVAALHPEVLEWLAQGEITLSALAVLAPHREDAELVAEARGKSRRVIQKLAAARHPDPDPGQAGRRRIIEDRDHRARRASRPDRPGARSRQSHRSRPRCRGAPGSRAGGGATAFIEADHVVPRALGGGHDQIRILCRSHNQRAAELALGQQHMDAARRRAGRLREVKSALVGLGYPAVVAGPAAEAALAESAPDNELESLLKHALRRAACSAREPAPIWRTGAIPIPRRGERSSSHHSRPPGLGTLTSRSRLPPGAAQQPRASFGGDDHGLDFDFSCVFSEAPRLIEAPPPRAFGLQRGSPSEFSACFARSLEGPSRKSHPR